jgi:transposase
MLPLPIRTGGSLTGHDTHFQRIAWVDNGYGQTVNAAANKASVTVDVVSGPKPGHRFIVQPRRWVVERTNRWINHCRHINRHYEITPQAHEGFVYLSQIAPLLRRLNRSQLFDTL